MEEGNELGGYRLIRRLGTGGAGTVWLAEDGGGTRVALKVMHPALATSEESRARLEREVRTVNSVRSPFVAHMIDAEIDASQPFVVSEYVEGPTLAEILSSGPIPLRGVAALSYHLALPSTTPTSFTETSSPRTLSVRRAVPFSSTSASPWQLTIST